MVGWAGPFRLRPGNRADDALALADSLAARPGPGEAGLRSAGHRGLMRPAPVLGAADLGAAADAATGHVAGVLHGDDGI